MKKFKVILFILAFAIIALWNQNILPSKDEISDIEIIKLIGIDFDENAPKNENARLNALVAENTTQPADSQGGVNNSKQQLITIKQQTFNNAVRKLQEHTENTITGSHVKYLLIGEKSAKKNMTKTLDFIARHQEVRLKTHIYIVKESNSADFMERFVSYDFKLEDRIASMEKETEYGRILVETDMYRILSQKLTDKKIYVIPSIKTVKKDKAKTLEYQGDPESKSDSKEAGQAEVIKEYFQFGGYAIFKNNKLITYLSVDESKIFDILRGESKIYNINIVDNEEKKDIISFTTNQINVKYSFDFDKDGKLEKTNISFKFRSNIQEVDTERSIYKPKVFSEYEVKQEKEMKKQIQEVIDVMKKYKCDFLGLEDKLKIQHPYKYEKIKDDVGKQLFDSDIIINTKCDINGTYDIIETNKEAK